MSHLISHYDPSLLNILKWEKDISTKEWCENNVYLHTDASPTPGMVRFDDTPHIEEVLRDFDKNYVWKQLLNWSTQTGKTFTMQCAWAKSMDTDPARVQWSIKNKNDVGDYLEEKIYPFLRGVDSLQKKIIILSEEKKKKLKAASINIPGGGTTFTGTTDAELRSKSAKYVFADEIALYDKGNFIELEGRTKAFERHFRKIMAVSSRKHLNDEMDVNYKTCETVKEWKTYCQECEEFFYAGSKHLKFMTKTEFMQKFDQKEETYNVQQHVKEALKDIYIECPNEECEHHISNVEKDKNIYDRKYKFEIVTGDEDGRTIGYKANALAVRITSLEIIVSLLINAEYEDDQDVLHQLYIDYFNEFYEKEYHTADQNDMLLLGNGVKEYIVPKDTVKIYLTIDNQMDYLFAQITAVGYGVVPHVMYFGRIETWSDAEALWEICQYLEDEDGENYMASKMGIDRRGYNEGQISRTDEADAFVNYMTQKWGEDRVYGMEGHAGLTGGKSFAVVNHKDYSNQRHELKIKIIKFSNLYIKNQLFRSIERTIIKAKAEKEEDDGFNYNGKLFYINQDNIDRDIKGTTNLSITKMLTAEVLDYAKHPKTGKLAPEKSWIPIRKRNDAIDTSTMALTFAEMDKIILMKKPSGENLEAALNQLGDLDFS